MECMFMLTFILAINLSIPLSWMLTAFVRKKGVDVAIRFISTIFLTFIYMLGQGFTYQPDITIGSHIEGIYCIAICYCIPDALWGIVALLARLLCRRDRPWVAALLSQGKRRLLMPLRALAYAVVGTAAVLIIARDHPPTPVAPYVHAQWLASLIFILPELWALLRRVWQKQ